MSRSFYVDALIVKEPSIYPKGERIDGNKPSSASPLHGSKATSISPTGISTPTSLHAFHHMTSYQRHHSDVLNLCCPLCIPSPSQLFPERTVAQIMSTTTLPLSFPSTPVSTSDYHYKSLHSVKRDNLDRPPSTDLKSSSQDNRRASPVDHRVNLVEQRRIRYGNLGKFNIKQFTVLVNFGKI